MILNKLLSLSWPRLLHVALSLLCALALVLGLASGALAASGDSSGNFLDFAVFYVNDILYFSPNLSPAGSLPAPTSIFVDTSGSPTNQGLFMWAYVLPSPLVSGKVSISSSAFNYFDPAVSGFTYTFSACDILGNILGNSFGGSFDTSYDLPSGTSFVVVVVQAAFSSSQMVLSARCRSSYITYSDFVYTSSSASDSDILDGLDAIAESIYDLQSGPYSGVSGVTVDSNGDLQHTVVNNATLENLLNAVGIATTDSNFVLRGMYNNFGSFFTYYDIDDSTSGTVVSVHGLPQYISALGSEVTDGINRLQRDHDLLYQQTADLASDLSDALYADTDTSPSESWSVAEWLRGIYNSITSFFTSFWSPAETELKEAAEDGMQAAADNGNAASASQVDEVNSAAAAFESFGSTGNIGSGDVMDIFSDSGSYEFFSNTTKENLTVHPPSSGQRDLMRSASSLDEEFIDELDDKLSYWRGVLGLR